MRAQRSNPDCLRGKTLDCSAALAITEFVDSSVRIIPGAAAGPTPGMIAYLFIRKIPPPVSDAATNPQ
ncbi:hypothetical protein FXV83_33295 [Bradyrhizobium hipponense]|uniref:Uncharacterized protein n=1 Tax=Bradyrhizobium hipponense TaxID=2605638 RepID=A0A5S4YD40_9BRAD|nr:hypothetical protein FXV83_33295 [Bradyrhizobium hipponense]